MTVHFCASRTVGPPYAVVVVCQVVLIPVVDSQIGKKLSSRYRGVCWNKKNRRWQAAINSSGKYLYLGSYVSEEEAARAFDRAAVRIRGKKARINFRQV